MKTERTHALVQEWRAIAAARKEVDYRLAKWASTVRKEFLQGTSGDESFFRWLENHLQLGHSERVEMLTLARSFQMVPDAETWATQGPAQIRKLADLPSKERAAVLGAAKVEGRKIGSVIQSRTQKVTELPSDVQILARFLRSLKDADAAQIVAEAITRRTVTAPGTVNAAAKRLLTRKICA